MKRRPPPRNVRRVQHIDGNIRSTSASKHGNIIQAESFNESKLIILLERDPTVIDYISQPETISFITLEGRHRRYTPDFKVWRADGRIELHEVTLAERRAARESLREREAAARLIYQSYGWHYIVHTEHDLPSGAELANLQHLYGYRAPANADPAITTAAQTLLAEGQRMRYTALRQQIAERLGMPPGQISGALLHLLWLGQLAADMHRLFFIDGIPAATFEIWWAGS